MIASVARVSYRGFLPAEGTPSTASLLFYTCGECTIFAGECRDAIPPSRLGDHSYFAYMQIDDIDSFYESVRGKGAAISKTLRDEPWGMREFGLVTADGHRIVSASPIADAE